MRKHSGIIILTLIMLLVLSSCGQAELSGGEQTLSPTENVIQNPPAVTVSPDAGIAHPPADTENPEPAADNTEREAIFRSFITENYQKLSDACFGGIAGIGFIDLDMDGGIEMLIFDAGASASMGVQFFDIIGGEVECVSANMQSMGEAFGGEHFTATYVNANYFDDFRLMKNKTDGELFYLVSSGNGALDFSYRELIRFGSKDGVLTLTGLLYKYEEYNADSGELISASYKVGESPASLAQYTSAYTAVYADSADTGLDAKGVFVWDSQSYTQDKDGLLAMTNSALSLSRENFPE